MVQPQVEASQRARQVADTLQEKLKSTREQLLYSKDALKHLRKQQVTHLSYPILSYPILSYHLSTQRQGPIALAVLAGRIR